MKLSRIRQMRNRTPFRPFQIHLTNGDILAVQHPEQMSLPEDEEEMFVLWTNHDWNLIEAEQVARISSVRRTVKPAR
jgi:hypothetical protein